MIQFRKSRGFTMLEVIVAATIIAAVIASTMSVIPKVIESLRREQKTSSYVQDGRNIVEMIQARGLDSLIAACGSENPCRSNNSDVNDLLPPLLSGLTSNDVDVYVEFYDGNGALVSDLGKATLARVTVTLERPNNQEPITFQTAVAAEFGHESSYAVTVRGNVRDEVNGSGLADVRVIFTSNDAAALTHEGKTDASGNYRIAGLQPGYYNITFKKDYYYEKVLSNVLIRENPTIIDETLREKGFATILSEHFDSTANLAVMRGTTVGGSRLYLGNEGELFADNPRFASYNGQSNITRSQDYAQLSSTTVSGNWLIASDDTLRLYRISGSGCVSSGSTSWINANKIVYENRGYTRGRIEYQPGSETGGLSICTLFSPDKKIELSVRLLHNNEVLSTNSYLLPEGWDSTKSYTVSLSEGTHTFELQGRAIIRSRVLLPVSGKTRLFRLFGTQRREHPFSGYVYKDYDFGEYIDRIRIDWDATVPSGTSLTFQVILHRDGGEVINIPKNQWVVLPKSVRYLRVRANFATVDYLASPRLRNYWIYTASTTGYAETRDYTSPDGPETDQVILRVNGVETQTERPEQLARVCEDRLVLGLWLPGGCRTFTSNFVTEGWSSYGFTLHKTGITEYTITTEYAYFDRSTTVSHSNSNNTKSTTFRIDYPQTVWVDYSLSAHAAVLVDSCAAVRIISPSGVRVYQAEVCGSRGIDPTSRGESKTGVPVKLDETGVYRFEAQVRKRRGNHSGRYSSAWGKVTYQIREVDKQNVQVTNPEVATLEILTLPLPTDLGRRRLRVEQLYVPRQGPTSIEYQVSNDGGATWVTIRPNERVQMPKPGRDYRVRILLHGSAGATPRIDQIILEGRGR